MRAGAVKVETVGSLWWLDDAEGRYMRLPKREAPRERPEWSDERAGVLQDAVWHPMVGWQLCCIDSGECCRLELCPGLVITYEADGRWLRSWAPNAKVAA